ncbi:cyclase family protein [Candidatus Binatus sp.]|uniref:cyclase family protein n=1 Tax=Candidatus Binatus sp. TaxID=2811406 RepID=UPI003C949457
MDSKRARLDISILLSVAFILGAPAIVSAQARSLADAYQIIASKQFVDLTHSFSPLTPVWKGFGPATFSAAADPATGRPYTIDHDGFRAQFFAMVGQYGTHIDPPAHFDSAGATVDEIPVKQMILRLVVFDLTPMLKSDPNHLLTVEDIEVWEQMHGRVPAGSFAALRTDMYKDWDSNRARFERYPFPAWSPAAIRFLYEQRGIVANGQTSRWIRTRPQTSSLRAGCSSMVIGKSR